MVKIFILRLRTCRYFLVNSSTISESPASGIQGLVFIPLCTSCCGCSYITYEVRVVSIRFSQQILVWNLEFPVFCLCVTPFGLHKITYIHFYWGNYFKGKICLIMLIKITFNFVIQPIWTWSLPAQMVNLDRKKCTAMTHNLMKIKTCYNLKFDTKDKSFKFLLFFVKLLKTENRNSTFSIGKYFCSVLYNTHNSFSCGNKKQTNFN